MKKRSDETPDWQDQRKKIIGLGESSLRKSYYPELREKVAELEKKNEQLRIAYEQLSASEEELHQNYDELSRQERELRESEEKYRSLSEHTFDGIVIHQDMVIRFANQTASRLMGYADPGDLVGRSIFSVVHPDYHQIVAERAAGALKEVQFPRHEVFVRDDKTTFDVDVVSSPTIWNGLPAAQVSFRDITAQKRAEEALQESEQRYRTLIETTDTGFVITDTEGRVVDANQKYVALSGHRTLEEIRGRNTLEWIAPPERDRNVQALAQCVDIGVLRNFETDYAGASGTETPVEINAAMVLFDNTSRILALCRDITERRKIERAQRESESFYRTLFNTTGSASIIIGEDTIILRANEGFARLSGYPVGELEGRHTLTEFIAPDDLRHMRRCQDALRPGTGAAPESCELRFADRQGTIRYCILYVAVIPGTTQSIASVVDITGRVIAEQALISAKNHLEAVYEGSPDLIFVHREDGTVIDMNENVLSAFGLTREEMMKVSPETTSGRGYTAEMAMQHFRRALESGQDDFPWVARRKNGGEFPVEVRLRRIESVNSRGQTEPRILAIVRDTTERTRAENALEQARKKLGLLNTVIFQDIQSSVFALSAYIQLAGSARNGEMVRSYADKEVLLVNKIVSSLNFTKNYQDLGIHPPRWQNVNQVFLYAISHLDSLKISRKIQVNGLEIFADPLLEKVFYNLVENSFIHGQRVTETSLSCEETEAGMMIVLADNGVGIPAAEKAKIFERGSGRNAGLGLFLVREILSITGITIRETGVEGSGARFEMLVPKGAYRIVETAGPRSPPAP